MRGNTRYFGVIDYEKEDILYLPKGLFGFEDQTEYLLIRIEDNNNLLLCMQSLQDENLAFILTNPFHFDPDYQPTLSRDDMDALNLNEHSEITFYVLCVIHETISESTMNLKCPIAINPETRQARQIILEDPSYTFKHPFGEFSQQVKEDGAC